MKIEYRAAEEVDIAATVSMLKGGGTLAGTLALAFAIAAIAATLVYAYSRSWPAPVATACVLFIPPLVSNLRFFKEVERRRAKKADARAVEVIHVDASRIIEVQPIGTGAAHVFFAGPGEALLVNGQWQLKCKPFPVAKFRLHRWADTKRAIRIESLGELVFPEESGVALGADYAVGDAELFQGDPETLQQDMDAAFGRQNS